MDNYKLCFIIAHRYYRNYESYIKYYVDNINKFYNDSLIIIVDNNSKYLDDIKNVFKNYTNVLFLINDTECKFELGAYKVGINYIIQNNLLEKYEYYIFTQDNFILKNKFDFNVMINNNTLASFINTLISISSDYNENIFNVLRKINMLDRINDFTMCCCNSFILNKIKILEFLDMTKDIIIIYRRESEDCERYLGGIIYKLNNYKVVSTDGIMMDKLLNYNRWIVNLIDDPVKERFFVKKLQQKNENTIED